MIQMPKPTSVMNIIFKVGPPYVVRSTKGVSELRGEMGGHEDEMITLTSIERQMVKISDQDQSIAYILGDQEVTFRRGDVLYFTLQEVMPPPAIVPASAGVPVIVPTGTRGPKGVM